MNKILKIEINRLLDILCELKNHTTFDAYIKELRNLDNLPYTELKYYLEQVKHTLETFDDGYSWGVELNVVNNALSLLKKDELESIEEQKTLEPIKLFWNSFKLWVEQDLPSLKILKEYYIRYDNWDGGTYFLDINMAQEFTKAYGLEYDDRFEKSYISIQDLKLYIELFYKQFVEDRYSFTKEVNKYLSNFKVPYKLISGKLVSKRYKTTQTNPAIINYPMFESKILWSEDKILGKELLDKHTALNYITDSLQYLLSIIDQNNSSKKQLEQKCALLINSDENSKIYAVIKKEVEEIQKIVNEYFDIRHNEYINKAKENREILNNMVFIEYLYNRIYALMMILRAFFNKVNKNSSCDVDDDLLPF